MKSNVFWNEQSCLWLLGVGMMLGGVPVLGHKERKKKQIWKEFLIKFKIKSNVFRTMLSLVVRSRYDGGRTGRTYSQDTDSLQPLSARSPVSTARHCDQWLSTPGHPLGSQCTCMSTVREQRVWKRVLMKRILWERVSAPSLVLASWFNKGSRYCKIKGMIECPFVMNC